MDKGSIESCYMPAALRALESFPVEVESVELVMISENVTFRISLRDSDSDYVLRLHRPGYNSIEELNSERLWTRALHDTGLTTQDSLLTISGQHFELIDIPEAAEQRYAGMTEWFAGMPLREYLDTCSDPEERKQLFRRIGGVAATIHNQSTNWNEPPGFVRRHLDIEGLLGEEPRWGRFWEHAELTNEEKSLLLRARDSARVALSSYGSNPASYSLIHSDLHPDNIICSGDNMALIDFDDSSYGWHMYEIASALIEDRIESDFNAICGALLDGYCEQRPLSEQDIDMLPTFLLIRGLAIIGWFHQRPEHTGSDYFRQIKNMVLNQLNAKGISG